MSFIKRIFRSSQANSTASIAKERLQIIVSHERIRRTGPDYLPMLQKELIEVIAKYVQIDKDQVKVELDRVGDHSILELNITLPEAATTSSSPETERA